MSDKPKYNVVQFSGGKDSTAMLLHMIELNMPIDEIIFCDTTVEFPEMYEHIDKVEKYIGRKITRLEPEHDYEYYLTEHKYQFRSGRNKGKWICGYAFPGAFSRWCTRLFKIDRTSKWLKEKKKDYDIVLHIGIAADEVDRVKEFKYPLVEWGWTEADCLKYCYDRGFDWGGLYKHFKRVSCWCCPLQSLDDLRNLWKHFPHLWKQLQEWQDKTWGHFSRGKRLPWYEERFKFEEERLKQGLPIGRNKDFHKKLKERCDEIDKRLGGGYFTMMDNTHESCKDVACVYYSKYDEWDIDRFLTMWNDSIKENDNA